MLVLIAIYVQANMTNNRKFQKSLVTFQISKQRAIKCLGAARHTRQEYLKQKATQRVYRNNVRCFRSLTNEKELVHLAGNQYLEMKR